MAGAWDSMTKRMIGANPEHFTKWLASEATFVAVLDLELKSKHLYADALLEITQEEKPGLLHIEVQTYHDPEMQVRLLEYNVLASRQYHHLPVYSYVICLLEDADVEDSPFIRRYLNGEEIHRFHYRVIRVWNIPAEGFLQLDWIGLIPLVSLTNGGKEPAIISGMIDRLVDAKEWDLLAISRLIGGLAFKKGPEREWFRKRFNMFQDILKESWVYQEIGQEFLEQGFEKGLEKGLEQGLEKGLEKGLEQGLELGLEKGLEKGREEERQKRVELLHLMLMSIVETQFPEITKLAKQHIDTIDDPDALQTAFIKLLAARNLEQAKGIFSEADKL
jgi:predicted transposase YdaD